MATKEVRPVRMCDSCGGVDDHPRHVYAVGPGDGQTDIETGLRALEQVSKSPEQKAAIMSHVRDNSTIMKHMDCCRTDGCPDGTCNEVTAGAEDKRGDALVKHLTKGGK
jgi:hypothetical protein